MRKIGPSILLILVALALFAIVVLHASAGESEEFLTAWKGWKSIEGAIAIRPLDGPEDIIERAEIIEDRVDDLARERGRLEGVEARLRDRLRQLRSRREALRDLEEIRLSGDAQSRQRLQDVAGRIRREEGLLKEAGESITGLEVELARMEELAAAYREKARILKMEESEPK